MERMTHARCSGIKQGYWSPRTKEELVQRLAMYEDIDPDPEHLKERIERAEGVKVKAAHGATRDGGDDWISTKDRLPERSGGYYVRCTVAHGGTVTVCVRIAFFQSDFAKFWPMYEREDEIIGKIYAWKPIATPDD